MPTQQAIQNTCVGSESVTHGIRVTAEPVYRPEHSNTVDGRYIFSYQMRISNESDRRVQLMHRRWTIIDGSGESSSVDGDGVVGERPIIEPGETYQYSSWCPLSMHWGTMEGSYGMHAEPGEDITVRVGRFYLVAPLQ